MLRLPVQTKLTRFLEVLVSNLSDLEMTMPKSLLTIATSSRVSKEINSMRRPSIRMILICIIFWYHWAERHFHTDDASRGITHHGAENMWRKPMSSAPNLVLTYCTVGKVTPAQCRLKLLWRYSFKDFLKDLMAKVLRMFKGNEFQFFAPSILKEFS